MRFSSIQSFISQYSLYNTCYISHFLVLFSFIQSSFSLLNIYSWYFSKFSRYFLYIGSCCLVFRKNFQNIFKNYYKFFKLRSKIFEFLFIMVRHFSDKSPLVLFFCIFLRVQVVLLLLREGTRKNFFSSHSSLAVSLAFYISVAIELRNVARAQSNRSLTI